MKYDVLTIHTDGGARGNPGPAAIGVVIEADGGVVHAYGERIGETTNNVAEYSAILSAFKYLKEQGSVSSEIRFLLDSQLVARQLSGIYKVKDATLRNFMIEIKKLEREVGERVSYTHIPREENTAADALVNKALDAV